MKTFYFTLFATAALLFISCESDSNDAPINENNAIMDLDKIVTVYSNNNVVYRKNIKHYVNNQVVSDSTFDGQDVYIEKREITFNGTTKTIKTYWSANDQLATHDEEYYDIQGRLIGRHTFEPVSALFFTYVYNNDGTVTSKHFNDQNNQTTIFRTFTKNTDGLINKENGSFYNSSTNQMENYEINGTLNGQKLLSTIYTGSTTLTTTFQYYPNPKPANLLKSVNELNNEIIMGNTLRYLAEDGNSYYKRNDSDIVNFNSDNYKTYQKTVSVNTNVTPNTTTTVERFYFYN